MAVVGGASLLALAVALPAQGQNGRSDIPISLSDRPIGSFTPAVRDPRLAATLARRRSVLDAPIRFTPATTPEERSRAIRVAVRGNTNALRPERSRPAGAAAAPAEAPSLVQIMPSSYNLGASVSYRRFALTGDVSSSAANGAVASGRESARIGVDYRASQRMTGRVQLGAERAEGVERIVGEDRAYLVDVGGSYSISRNLDVSAGARYRVSRDRLEPLARDERRDSHAVYIGTSLRF